MRAATPRCDRAAPRLMQRRGWLGAAAALLLGGRGAAGTAPVFDDPLAQQALAALADAPSHGLPPRDDLIAALDAALRRAGSDAEARRAIDEQLHAALLGLLIELQQGRVDPRRLGMRFAGVARRDVGALLREALAARDLRLAVQGAVPALAQYERLRQALAAYRRIAAGEASAWQQPLPTLPRPAQRVEPGQDWPGVPRLAARLAALGDLVMPPQPGSAYAGALVDAVRAFQRRHGLDDDGVIGRVTLAALQVAPAQRARQIELNLERLRWTPLLGERRRLVINVPEFVLRGYELVDGRVVVRLAMRVIVGRALAMRTPLIDEPMRRIEFKPAWNVPASIARAEVVPRLARDPAWWDAEGFEFVDAAGAADARLDAARLDAVLAGRLRIRQRPGPRNPLGDVKFVFPNADAIYLHDTPAAQLFGRARRDFSHGCIRVEDPLALASFALQGAWSRPRIAAAMSSGAALTVALPEPLPVLIAYGTALVKDGRPHFFDDLYGHDRALEAALVASPRR